MLSWSVAACEVTTSQIRDWLCNFVLLQHAPTSSLLTFDPNSCKLTSTLPTSSTRVMMEPSNANIPVIDVSPSNPDAPNQLLSAASKYGFVFIENSPDVGVPPQQIAEMFDLSKTFFAAPTEVKEEVSIGSNKAGKNHGWLRQGIEKLDPKTPKKADVKEYEPKVL